MRSLVPVLCFSLLSVFSACILPSFSSAEDSVVQEVQQQQTPKSLISSVINEARDTIIAAKGKLERESLQQKLRDIIYPAFDFREMARRSLGARWKLGSTEQQSEFVTLFSDLLGQNYLDQVIDGIEDTEVRVVRERVRKRKALVKSTIITSDSEIAVDYRLKLTDGKWQVYDVIIENIGLVVNYRNEFAGIIRKDGFDGLLSLLREKLESRNKKKEEA